MTLGENLCRTYGLTSLKRGGCSLALLAINEALEAAAQIADREESGATVASRIRSLKWAGDKRIPLDADRGKDYNALTA
jgi:hypothetical protein